MKKKRNKGIVAYIVIIIYLLCVGAVGFSFLSADFFTGLKAAVTGTIIFDNGSFSKDAGSITVELNKGEAAKLSGVTGLKSAVLSGSEIGVYEEIAAWAEGNPQVDVTYSFLLPDGSSVTSKSEDVDLSGVTPETFPEYFTIFKYLTHAKTVELGSQQSGSSLSPENIASLQREYPHLRFSYTTVLADRPVNILDSSVDLRSLTAAAVPEAVSWLGCMKFLDSVSLGDENTSPLSLSDVAALSAACPDAVLDYSLTLYGYPLNLKDDEINLSHVPVEDDADAVIAALRCMKNCKKLDMDYCGVGDLRMEQIRDLFPDVEVVWRIWFGECYSVRTDTERILASRPSVGGMLDNTVGDKLKYCTKIKYLDLGHNDALTDISFVRYMPDLEVFIIAINTQITDISPLSACQKLEYLELNSTPVSDISCLAGLTSLHHLNIAGSNVSDISPLYNCTELERLWIGQYTPVPGDQVARMMSLLPDCDINVTTDDPHGESWRYNYHDINTDYYDYVPRYHLLREQLGYSYSEYSYYWKDPLCGDPCPPQYVGTSPDGIIEKPQSYA